MARFTLGVVPTGADGKPQPRPAEPTKYLRSLQERTAYIDIRGLQVGSGRAHSFPIDELYIPLTTSVRPEVPRARREAKGELPDLGPERESRVELHEALRQRCLVIVGDPGSGKTTFLRRIANLLCRAQLGDKPEVVQQQLGLDDTPFPILIQLGELAEHVTSCRKRNEGPTLTDAPAWLAHFLAKASEDSGTGLDETFFRERLESGSALVLLDGLDEAPTEQQRKLLTSLVQKASQEGYTGCGFVLTSRPAAYRGEAVLPRFAHVQIDALEEDAIKTFLTRWCEAVFSTRPSQRQQYLTDLLAAFRGRAEIRRMARNPVMLTALAVVHWNEKRLPEQRADLYDSIISWLARSREARPGRPSPERCVALHQELALAMQDHPDGLQTQVPRFWAANQIADEWRDAPEGKRVALAEAFLVQDELDSGIVAGRGDHVRFWHLTFQEYLAARALASRDDQRGRLLAQPDKLHQPEWREVVLLLAGVLYHQGRPRVDALFSAVFDQLGDDASLADQARCFGLLGAAVQDLAPVKYQPGDPRYPKVAEEVMGIFDVERSQSVRIDVAIEAAEALGLAGDPRFAIRKLMENWVEIPAGEFLMGAQKKKRSGPNHDPEAVDSESPVHEVHLEAYRIGRYPVTVGEYQRFVDDGGYAKEEYWKAGGFGQWERLDEWDEQLSYPNRPVVNVSWYEAAAYAAWAGVRVCSGCRLPTEAEWERAARGTEGRRYPWGDDDPSPSLANYYDGKVGHPTPVGVYPRGATVDGIQDMGGNVWEWCCDWFDQYPGDAQVDPQGPSSGTSRVFRGGSWDNNEIGLRSAFRYRLGLGLRLGNMGFRVAAGT